MGKVGRIVAGAVLVAGAVVVGVFTGQWGLAAAIGSTGARLILQRGVDEGSLEEKQGQVFGPTRASPHERLPVVYGRARVPGFLVDIRVDTASQNDKRLVVVVAFCHGSQDGSGVDAVEEIYFDDTLAWSSTTGIQDPYHEALEESDSLQDSHLHVTIHLGTTSQAVDSNLNLLFPTPWPTTSTGKDVCYAVLMLWYNTDIYPSGVPNISAVVRGNKLYDPRDMSTVWSQNPALMIRDYLTSPVYGCGIDEALIDDQSIEDVANYGEELVSLPEAATQERFLANGWLDTRRPRWENLATLAMSGCRGQIVSTGGFWSLRVRRVMTVSGIKINPHNTVEGTWRYILPGSTQAPNVGRATYVDSADLNYRTDTVQWPEPGETNQYLTDDGGVENVIAVDLAFCDNRLRAQQFIMTLLRESREGIVVNVVGMQALLLASVGDLVEVSQPSPGWVDKPFWVEAMQVREDGNVDLLLAEYEPTVYTLDEQFPQPTIPDTGLPDSFFVAAPTSLDLLADDTTALEMGDYSKISRIRVRWNNPNPSAFVTHFEVEARREGDVVFDSWGTVPSITTLVAPLGGKSYTFYISPVTESELWHVRVRAVNRINKRSEWVGTSVTVGSQGGSPQSFIDGFSATQNAASPEDGDVAIEDPHGDSHGDAAHGDGHNDAHCDFSDTFHCDCTIPGYHADEPGPCVSSGHSDTAHSDSAHSDSHTDAAGEFAYSNLEDANKVATVYNIYFDVDATGIAGGNSVWLDVYVNDGAASTNWVLVVSAGPYDNADNLTDETIAFAAALGPDYDIRVAPRYATAPGANVATFTLHGEDHGSQAGVQFIRRNTVASPARFVLPVGTDLWAES